MNYNIEIVVPLYGDCTNNLYNLINSVKEQERGNWHIHLAADLVNKETMSECKLWDTLDQRITYYPNKQNKRMYALKNICRVLDGLENKKETIIGIVDGDDQLMDPRAFTWVCEEYEKGYGVVWTKNIWDQYNVNNSSDHFDDSKSPYEHPWVSSHFRTFPLSYYNKVNKKNFKDENGGWFRRCYDQALMLPIIEISHKEGKETQCIPKACYIYRGRYNDDGESLAYQQQLEKFMRKRGYIE